MADDQTMNKDSSTIIGPDDEEEIKSSPDNNNNDDDASDSATATDTYDEYDDDDDDDDLSQDSYEDDDRGRPLPMPPLKYARIMGSLPRDNKHYNSTSSSSCALSVKVTCSTMGRVVIRPSTDDKSHHHASIISDTDVRSTAAAAATTTTAGVHISEYEDDEDADRSQTKVCHVIAMGFQDGKVRLVDVSSGGSVLFGSSLEDGGAWFVNPSLANKRPDDPENAIVALSFDSSSSYLCALNVRGDAAIFGPLEWGRQSQRVSVNTDTNTTNREGASQKGFFSAFVGGGGGNSSTSDESKVGNNVEKEENANRVLRPSFTLIKPPSSTVRFSYANQQKGCHPVCMALDPAYGKRKERAVLVGFNDGRLIFSKLQGGGVTAGVTSFFGGGAAASTVKKLDSVIYQGMGTTSSVTSGDKFGIEAIAWRGGLVAWADSSGVRLFDIECMSRIAHIDRPTGARSNLYPTVSSLRPSILFEKSNSLLIGWGDCLMAMVIRDTKSSTVTKDGTTVKEIKKKTVDCTMAWELDCVACSVVPMDEKHVAVLGLVPSASMDETFESDNVNSQIAGGDNVIELQVINREDGKSISNDSIPLVDQVYTDGVDNSIKRIRTGNAAEFTLLSSYAVSRMDDLAEWEALDDGEKAIIEREADTVGVRGTKKSGSKKFSDLHQRWKMTTDVCSSGKEILQDALAFDHENDDDESTSSHLSACSDNYVFALSEPINDILSSDLDHSARSSPPIMAVVYTHDVCLVQTRDVDDAISFARSTGKSALALKYALAHRRDIRRHELNILVDDYFSALLRFGRHSDEGKPLSSSRVRIATESLPILLGGDSRMWQRWIFMFARIPGGLFLLREKIPVRDPHLPGYVFEMVLEKMLEETVNHHSQRSTVSDEYDGHDGASDKMTDLFLETLRSWGPTSSLRKRIQLRRYYSQKSRNDSSFVAFVKQAEKDLQRRISQTAFGVLSDAAKDPASMMENISTRQAIDASKDSLFDVDNLIDKFSSGLQLNGKSTGEDYQSPNILVGRNSDITSIFAIAELEMMREKFDRALGYYLSIGSSFMTESLPLLEEAAVLTVNHSQEKVAVADVTGSKYDHVISLLEMHQLHYILLSRNYSFVDKTEAITEPPIVALIMLVGLSKAGRFLMDCLSPPDTKSDADGETDDTNNSSSDSNLPLDAIAAQLTSRPKLLYWFLFQVFTKRPDMYVKFPTTSVPPLSITNLHRAQFSLFLDYADESEGEMISEPMSSPSMTVDSDSPFMSFLRSTIPHGGVDAETVRERLGSYRGGRVDNPVFARELAFVTEKFGKGTLDESKEVLNLYLLGAKNLSMAVAFAERDTKHSKDLWKMLVDHCTVSDPASVASEKGALFGSLLEAAAHCGADLASLVSSIPEGMSIEGLRPKLIAAITDYRHKVRIHEYTADALSKDKVSLLRELCHLSRRGERAVEMKVREGAHKQDRYSSNKLSLLQMQRMKSGAITMRHPSSFSLSIR